LCASSRGTGELTLALARGRWLCDAAQAKKSFCLILDPGGELLGRRAYEVGEWYVAEGLAKQTEFG
jgi:hypothetical protein